MSIHLLPNRLYNIPEQNLHDLQTKIAKLAKRADKIGVPAPTITEIATIEHKVVDPDFGETGEVVRRHILLVTGDAPKFAGWEMLAVIEMDHEEPDAPNVVDVLPGQTIKPLWRDTPERCDHCNVANRRRNKLVVVAHPDEGEKIVGTTCLKDFLGHAAPDAIASWAEILFSFDPAMYEDEDMERAGGGHMEERFDPEVYLGWVVRAIIEDGWVSRGSARFDYTKEATADIAKHQMDLASGRVRPGPRESRPVPLTAEERAEATAAWEWAQAQQPTNDYLANVCAIAARSSLRTKHLGLAASIVSGFQRDRDQAAEKAAKEAAGVASQHFGEVKERLVLTGEVMSVRAIESDFGTKGLVKILTDEGNIAVWWASNLYSAPEPGDRVTGKATVKGHDEFGGENQTTVTRFTWEKV